MISEVNRELLEAALRNDCERVRELIDARADVNCTDKCGWTPLHRLASKGCLTCTQLLLEHNAESDKRTENGLNAVHTAAMHGHLAVLKLLFNHRVDFTVVSNEGWLPLHQACMNGHAEAALYLLCKYSQVCI